MLNDIEKRVIETSIRVYQDRRRIIEESSETNQKKKKAFEIIDNNLKALTLLLTKYPLTEQDRNFIMNNYEGAGGTTRVGNIDFVKGYRRLDTQQQYFTPSELGEMMLNIVYPDDALIEKFPDLYRYYDSSPVVFDACFGSGKMYWNIKNRIKVFGIEKDPEVYIVAKELYDGNSNFIIVNDNMKYYYRGTELGGYANLILGNPPFGLYISDDLGMFPYELKKGGNRRIKSQDMFLFISEKALDINGFMIIIGTSASYPESIVSALPDIYRIAEIEFPISFWKNFNYPTKIFVFCKGKSLRAGVPIFKFKLDNPKKEKAEIELSGTEFIDAVEDEEKLQTTVGKVMRQRTDIESVVEKGDMEKCCVMSNRFLKQNLKIWKLDAKVLVKIDSEIERMKNPMMLKDWDDIEKLKGNNEVVIIKPRNEYHFFPDSVETASKMLLFTSIYDTPEISQVVRENILKQGVKDFVQKHEQVLDTLNRLNFNPVISDDVNEQIEKFSIDKVDVLRRFPRWLYDKNKEEWNLYYNQEWETPEMKKVLADNLEKINKLKVYNFSMYSIVEAVNILVPIELNESFLQEAKGYVGVIILDSKYDENIGKYLIENHNAKKSTILQNAYLFGTRREAKSINRIMSDISYELIARFRKILEIPYPLYNYQKEDLAKLLTKKRILLSYVMGLGKTRTAIAYALLKDFNRSLFIVPAQLVDEWRIELRKLGVSPHEIKVICLETAEVIGSDGRIKYDFELIGKDLRKINLISFHENGNSDLVFQNIPQWKLDDNGKYVLDSRGKRVPEMQLVEYRDTILREWQAVLGVDGSVKPKDLTEEQRKKVINAFELEVVGTDKTGIPFLEPETGIPFYSYTCKVRFDPSGSGRFLRENKRWESKPMMVVKQEDWLAYYLRDKFDFVCLDESYFVSRAGKFITRAVNLFNPEYRMCLTGTPIRGYPIDFFYQMNWLASGQPGLWSSFDDDARFYSQTFSSWAVQLVEVPIYKDGKQIDTEYEAVYTDTPTPAMSNVGIFKEMIAPFMLRRKREEINDIYSDKVKTPGDDVPPYINIPQIDYVEVKFNQEQAKMYCEKCKELLLHISNAVKAGKVPHILDFAIKLLRICQCPQSYYGDKIDLQIMNDRLYLKNLEEEKDNILMRIGVELTNLYDYVYGLMDAKEDDETLTSMLIELLESIGKAIRKHKLDYKDYLGYKSLLDEIVTQMQTDISKTKSKRKRYLVPNVIRQELEKLIRRVESVQESIKELENKIALAGEPKILETPLQEAVIRQAIDEARTGNKVIIFSNNDDAIQYYEARLISEFSSDDLKILSVTGEDHETSETISGTKVSMYRWKIDTFKKNPNYKILIVQTKVFSVGTNIPEASVGIFDYLEWTPSIISQCLWRMVRPGQKKQVRGYIYFISGTLQQYTKFLMTYKRESIENALDNPETQGEESPEMTADMERMMEYVKMFAETGGDLSFIEARIKALQEKRKAQSVVEQNILSESDESEEGEDEI